MSSVTHHDSDSEDDPDYVPTADPDSDDDDDDDNDKSVLENTGKSSPKRTEKEKTAEKKAREALWATFQASVTSPPSATPEESPKTMVKIEKRYRFAGEIVVEVVEVPEGSPEAKKWPIWRPPDREDASTASNIPQPLVVTPEPNVEPSSGAATVSQPASTSKVASKRPGPRKPRTSLAPLPNSTSQKAKKISTLDKSAMDWRVHINSQQDSGMKDELEANRRGGGFLEKMDFLQRVEERREDALEAGKSSKRRRL